MESEDSEHSVCRVKMRVSILRTRLATVQPAENKACTCTWNNEVLVFEGLPRDTDNIRFDVGKDEAGFTAVYRAQVPVKMLKRGVTIDRWKRKEKNRRRCVSSSFFLH